MSGWPFLRSPFTDLTAHLLNHQNEGACAKLEMKVIDCLEAYGMDRGEIKCDLLLKDFQECVRMDKQMKRVYAMRLERQRQYWAGERSKKDLWAESPKRDSY